MSYVLVSGKSIRKFYTLELAKTYRHIYGGNILREKPTELGLVLEALEKSNEINNLEKTLINQ